MTYHFDRRSLMLALSAAGAGSALPAFAQRGGPALPAVADVPAAAPNSVGMAADLSARLNAVMQGHIDAGRISGGVTAVARRNKLVHFSPHGMFDIEAATPMRQDGLFVMMSSTKPITGVALLQQMEEGKVSLDDPITKFIPELKDMKVRKAGAAAPGRGATIDPASLEPASRLITIKDLATHTSGLNGAPRAPQGTPNTLAARIPWLKDTPLDFQPGTKWAYSATTGPDVLARVIEITSGMSYDRYLRERIFQPIGMRDTGHNLTAEQAARVVPRYTRVENAWRRAPANPAQQTTFFAGSYGLSSTAHDYLLFETMLLNKGTIHGRRVLRPESVELMRSNLVGDLYKGIGGVTQGTGFGVLVRTVLDPATCGCGRAKGGFGWGGAYGTMTWTDPGNELVGVLMIQQSVAQVQSGFEMAVRQAITA
jgi:CubicO group peptidase (beta-lactamase class C family)